MKYWFVFYMRCTLLFVAVLYLLTTAEFGEVRAIYEAY